MMGSHFHDWIDYNGVAFSIELLVREWGRTFPDPVRVKQFFTFTVSKRTRMFVLQATSKVFFIQSKIWVIHNNRYWYFYVFGKYIKIGICPKVAKIGSIIGHRIDYNG